MLRGWVASGPGLGRGIAAGPVRRTRISQGYLFDHEGWIDVPIPGDVHRALMVSGRIEDPFYDRNEEGCA